MSAAVVYNCSFTSRCSSSLSPYNVKVAWLHSARSLLVAHSPSLALPLRGRGRDGCGKYRSYAPAWERKPETLPRLVRWTPGHPKLRKAPLPQPLSRLRAVALQRAGPEGEGVSEIGDSGLRVVRKIPQVQIKASKTKADKELKLIGR